MVQTCYITETELRTNVQLGNFYEKEDIVQFISAFAGRTAWQADGCLIKGTMTWTLAGRRPRGRLQRRWTAVIRYMECGSPRRWNRLANSVYNKEKW